MSNEHNIRVGFVTPETPDDPIESATARDRRNRFSLLSHDLRSALSDILGGVRLIETERLDQASQAHFDRISAAGETLARLLDKTLSDDPGGDTQQLTQAVNVTLSDFLRDVRRRWSDHAEEKGIVFEVVTGKGLPAVVTFDRVSLDRIIANLVGNAIKFTDEGRVLLNVECGADRSLRFVVRDEGPGFSQAALVRLFQFEGRPIGTEKPGTGLGLHIAKELSEHVGADLSVRNLDEGGSEAILSIPHEAWFDRSLRREGRLRQTTQDGAVDLSNMTILLAEDNKTNQLVATQMLGAMGAKFKVASDGLEALDLIETETFDLALLDIEMPRMSGLELIKAIRSKSGPIGDMPLVALTAYVMREHRERIYGAGADGIIAKPLMSIEELGQAILDFYNRRKAQGQSEMNGSNPASVVQNQIVDRDVFDNLVETIGPDSTAELLAKLQADTDTVAEGLVRGQKHLDLSEIRSQTHILISVAGAIGAGSVQMAAQRLNTSANRQDSTEIESLCEECLSGLAELQGFILDEQAKAEA